MSKEAVENFEIKSPIDCLNVKLDSNDPNSKKCMYFMNQFLEEENKICHNESCNVEEHKKARATKDLEK